MFYVLKIGKMQPLVIFILGNTLILRQKAETTDQHTTRFATTFVVLCQVQYLLAFVGVTFVLTSLWSDQL